MADGICPFANQIANHGQLIGYQAGYYDRVGFCDHTAGGYYETMTRVSFWNDPNGNGDTSDAVSVHFAIARDGRICQILNIFDTAFAQGRDARGQPVSQSSPGVTWAPFAEMGYRNPNTYLVSTEHEDVEKVNGQTVYIPGSKWTEAQYQADLKLKRWCIDEVLRVTGKDMMRFGPHSLAGHHNFDPTNRKECPGRFWRDEYRTRLYTDLSGWSAPQEEIMTRFNAVVPRIRDASPRLTTPQTIALGDFDQPIPTGTKRLEIEVYLATGSQAVQVLDSDGKYAGQVGWDGARYGRVEVDVSGGGFTIQGVGTLAQVGVVAVA